MQLKQNNHFVDTKLKNVFDKLSKVKIFRAIEDGLSSVGNLLLFGSLFIVILKLPQIFGATYSQEFSDQIDKVWLISVGLMALFFSGTVAKFFTESLNDKLKLNQRLESLTPMIVAMISYLLLVITSVNNDGELEISLKFDSFNIQGILTALIVGLMTSYIFYGIRKHLILNKKETNIPGSFFDKIIIMVCTSVVLILFWGLGWIWSKYVSTSINNLLDNNFSFWIRKYADTWYGLPILYSGYALSWFTGIHGPTVFAPITNPINIANDFWNQQVFLGLKHGSYHLATWGTDNFIACFGGTGSTFVVPFLFMLFAKSQKLKKVGKTAVVSTSFGANEPLLFGGPLILNKYFFIPMMLTPLFNLMMLKTFISIWGMRGFVTQLSWTTPGPLGIIFGTGMDWKSIILILVILFGDSLIYLPSVLIYDQKILKEPEEKIKEIELIAQESNSETSINKLKLLLICSGGATSGALANKLVNAALNKSLDVEASGSAWGQHKEKLQDLDFIILAPQVNNQKDVLEKQLEGLELKTKILTPRGIDYIHYSQKPNEFLESLIKLKEEEELLGNSINLKEKE